jgi:hypothetical protein
MSKIYVYPEALREKANYGTGYPFVSFEFIKRALPESAAIYLYLPPGFSVPDGASYGGVDLGIIGSGASGALTTDEKKAVATEAVGKVLNEIGAASIFTKEKIQAGEAMNPNTVLQFDNVNVRTFNFTFKLVAESSKEAQSALYIENMFRAALYPEVKNRLYLEYPPTFKIKFYHGGKENMYMPQIMESYLSNMNTTYNASSNMYHADGSPSEIDLTLTFTETKAITREALYPNGNAINNQTGDSSFSVDSIERKIKDKISSIRDLF